MNPNAPSPEKTDARWYYADAQNQPVGPVAFDDLQRLAATDAIAPETQVIEEGGTEWRPYRSIAAPRPPMPPPAPMGPQPTVPVRRWPAVVSVLLLYPLGLIVLWLSNGYTTKIKAVITAVSLFLLVLGIGTGHAGFIMLALVFNALVFTWMAESLKRGAKLGISVALGVMLLPALSADTANLSSMPTSSEGVATSEMSVARPSPEEMTRIGDVFHLGDFKYRITNIRRLFSMGGRFNYTVAPPGAVFVVVDYHITNESRRTQTVLADDFVIRDSEGREFRSSSKVNTALAMTERDKDLFLTELQPGLTHRGMVGFEMPRGATKDDLVLVVPEKGVFGSKSYEVFLKSRRAEAAPSNSNQN